ncbi:hypothetical protein DSECCO2_362240 [anaerobic digester metagenome]|uniref:hypothetical protein n=1 Tax=Oscillibacter ruminantium TaxID=1263547 RepID=UPI0003184A43|nr:hypothetical protein [Oscillibacter ruminantium]
MTDNEASRVCTDEQESPPPAAPKAASVRERRVGTFTFGIVLVIAGLTMTSALFFPSLDFQLLMKLSPAVLILLGIEVLLSTRKGGRIKYDWLGMLLCFVIVILALGVFFTSWAMIHFPKEYLCW